MTLSIIGNRKFYYLLSGAIVGASILTAVVWGLKPGLDFAGGSLWELKFTGTAPATETVRDWLRPYDLGGAMIQASGGNVLALRFREIDEARHQTILKDLAQKASGLEELRFETVGPTIGLTLRRKAAEALITAILGISLYIAWAFRKVSRPLASWKYGVATVITLFHDVSVPIGLFAVLGKLAGVEIDSNFIVALLVVMGFSVHDTIVVFDRIRENIRRTVGGNFSEVVNRSVNETLARSINTSLTTVLALVAVVLWGAANLKFFVLAMIAGIITGTYSSIFIASPLLVDWERFQSRKGPPAGR